MKEKMFERIVLFLAIYLLMISMFAIASTYQTKRYHAGTPGYKPQWNGAQWVPEPGKFTCIDYTKEALGFFDMIGITSYQVVGDEKGTGTPHSWVGIDVFGCIINFEPQTLMFFDPSGEYCNVTVNKRMS